MSEIGAVSPPWRCGIYGRLLAVEANGSVLFAVIGAKNRHRPGAAGLQKLHADQSLQFRRQSIVTAGFPAAVAAVLSCRGYGLRRGF